jgi:hypothetical protein
MAINGYSKELLPICAAERCLPLSVITFVALKHEKKGIALEIFVAIPCC